MELIRERSDSGVEIFTKCSNCSEKNKMNQLNKVLKIPNKFERGLRKH